ncbi:hypothetical protein AB0O64_36805 [Streptomyces sp. NPDC088341]|uniref:hypothetical protein n=1 Tax=Streptomyces sp. NPDC088341 TaxID=3154870 RepID=UPI0034443392
MVTPGYFEPEDIAIRRLLCAHAEEYNRLLEEAEGELPNEGSCESCACLGSAALELSDVLGHDKQGHQTFRCLYGAGQIHDVDGLRRALELDLGLSHLRGQGLGAGGLERIHDSMRRLERVRPEPGWRPAR